MHSLIRLLPMMLGICIFRYLTFVFYYEYPGGCQYQLTLLNVSFCVWCLSSKCFYDFTVGSLCGAIHFLLQFFVDRAPALMNTQAYWIIGEISAPTWKVTFLIFFSNSLYSSVVFHAYMNEAFESTLRLSTEDIVYTTEDNFYPWINSQWPSKMTSFQVCRWKRWGIATRDTH